ncbi:MAG TPA: tellurite resistance/C4-dicarboxylate transporter family protein [Marmoricola sp.]|nr:tellurite resistance/C4-dicarboxylate transporter family protein [Marmoricola sp.]
MSGVGLSGRVGHAVEGLAPGYFALVMATGIVSIAMYNHGLPAISLVLLWLAVVEYALLVVLYAVRWFAFRHAVVADFADPARAFGYFTFVAGTCVVGTRLAVDGHWAVAIALGITGALAWLVLGYVVPWTAVLGKAVRPVLQSANGTWFIWVVASQSIAVLTAMIEPHVHTGRRELALLAVFSWSIGVFLYAAAGVFVSVRMLFFELRPIDLTPPYFVAMGATAITVVAGARIVQMADAPMVAATRGLIAGASVFFWAFGTWLIPPLIAAGVWRHIVHKIPLRYEAAMWSVVFPLGMYGVGGHFLGQADHLPIVEGIGANESWVALAAWLVTFGAMLVNLWQSVIHPGRPRG